MAHATASHAQGSTAAGVRLAVDKPGIPILNAKAQRHRRIFSVFSAALHLCAFALKGLEIRFSALARETIFLSKNDCYETGSFNLHGRLC